MATKAIPLPQTSSLLATFFGGKFVFSSFKKVFFLSGQAPPPLLVAVSLKKDRFFAASLRAYKNYGVSFLIFHINVV